MNKPADIMFKTPMVIVQHRLKLIQVRWDVGQSTRYVTIEWHQTLQLICISAAAAYIVLSLICCP